MCTPSMESIAHTAFGFGLALLIQSYTQDMSFAPLWVGWALVIVAVAAHLWPRK